MSKPGSATRVAIHWEGEPGDSRTITYAELQREVCKTANALLALGLETGDRVAIYLPMIPEAVFSMLACARLGLTHTVIFGGFSAEAIRSRVADSDRQADHHRRRPVPPRPADPVEGGGRRGRQRSRVARSATSWWYAEPVAR